MVSRGGFALWLDADLYHGSSFSCPTFRNASLSTQEDFIVQDLEVWTVHNWGKKSDNSFFNNKILRCLQTSGAPIIEPHLCKIYKFALIWQLYRLRLAPRLKRLSGLRLLSALVLSVARVAGLPLIFPGSAGVKHWLFINSPVLSSARCYHPKL